MAWPALRHRCPALPMSGLQHVSNDMRSHVQALVHGPVRAAAQRARASLHLPFGAPASTARCYGIITKLHAMGAATWLNAEPEILYCQSDQMWLACAGRTGAAASARLFWPRCIPGSRSAGVDPCSSASGVCSTGWPFYQALCRSCLPTAMHQPGPKHGSASCWQQGIVSAQHASEVSQDKSSSEAASQSVGYVWL